MRPNLPTRQVARPDLSTGEGGIIDPAYLSKKVRADWDAKWLRRSAMTPEQRVAYLNAVNDRMQDHPKDLTPLDTQRNEIERVRKEARRLRYAIEAMGAPARETLQAHTDFLAFSPDPPENLPANVTATLRISPDGDFLANVWDWTRGVEVGAEYSTRQFRFGRGDKPEQHNARSLVSRLAEAYQPIAGGWPPTDRASWFADFAQAAWYHLFPKSRLKVGARLLVGGVDQAKRTTFMDQKS